MPIDINFGALEHANPFAAYAKGQDIAAVQRQRQASGEAGRRLAAGDQAGAKAAYGAAGMTDEVRDLQRDERAQEQTDYTRQRQAQQDQIEALRTVSEGLKSVPKGSRLQALQGVMPVFQQMQIDTAPFAKLTEDQLSDENLNMFTGEIDKHLQGVNLGGGGYGVFNQRTGDFTTVREPNPRLQSVAGGATLYDPGTREAVYTAPKTFAPPRASGGRGGASIPPPPSGWRQVSR